MKLSTVPFEDWVKRKAESAREIERLERALVEEKARFKALGPKLPSAAETADWTPKEHALYIQRRRVIEEMQVEIELGSNRWRAACTVAACIKADPVAKDWPGCSARRLDAVYRAFEKSGGNWSLLHRLNYGAWVRKKYATKTAPRRRGRFAKD
jgi:hypothetical protein